MCPIMVDICSFVHCCSINECFCDPISGCGDTLLKISILRRKRGNLRRIITRFLSSSQSLVVVGTQSVAPDHLSSIHGHSCSDHWPGPGRVTINISDIIALVATDLDLDTSLCHVMCGSRGF